MLVGRLNGSNYPGFKGISSAADTRTLGCMLLCQRPDLYKISTPGDNVLVLVVAEAASCSAKGSCYDMLAKLQAAEAARECRPAVPHASLATWA